MSTSRKTVIGVPLTLPVLIPLLIISACFQFLISIVWRKTELQGRDDLQRTYFTNSGCIHKAESTYPFSQIWIVAALLIFLSLKRQPDLLLKLESPYPTFQVSKGLRNSPDAMGSLLPGVLPFLQVVLLCCATFGTRSLKAELPSQDRGCPFPQKNRSSKLWDKTTSVLAGFGASQLYSTSSQKMVLCSKRLTFPDTFHLYESR